MKGLHRIASCNVKERPHQAILEIRYRRVMVWPPVANQRHYPELRLTVIHATERGEPAGRERIEWRLFTDLPANSPVEAIEKLDWYALRWKIETFHKNLKSGCKAEESHISMIRYSLLQPRTQSEAQRAWRHVAGVVLMPMSVRNAGSKA